MIDRIEISGLFGLYNYDLDLSVGGSRRMSIITGPNGFGKTTVLQLINALYTQNYRMMMSTVFDTVVYHFDNKVFRVHQVRTFEDVDGDSDLPAAVHVSLDCSFSDESETDVTEYLIVDPEIGGDDAARVFPNHFNLFMNSRQCFYISDTREVNVKTDTGIHSDVLGTSLLQKDITVFKSLLVDLRYDAKDECSLDSRFLAKLNLFREIIGSSRFAGKTMQISSSFGIRFKMDNELGEFIGVEQLSSGEKHILLQTLELLFFAKDGVVALIDEPELSLHPAWLNRYVDNMEKIQNLKSLEGKPFQVILATHSPTLIGQRWNECIDLYEHQRNG